LVRSNQLSILTQSNSNIRIRQYVTLFGIPRTVKWICNKKNLIHHNLVVKKNFIFEIYSKQCFKKQKKTKLTLCQLLPQCVIWMASYINFNHNILFSFRLLNFYIQKEQIFHFEIFLLSLEVSKGLNEKISCNK